MKKIMVLILIVVFLMFSFGSMVIAENSPGPAPNAGLGLEDGSGFTDPAFPFGNGDTPGPAPGSGDGIPDGPEW